MHNEELHNLYSYKDDEIKDDEMDGRAAHMEEVRSAYKKLVEKFEGNRSLGRSRYRWEDNTKTDFKETGRGLD
jgi:hypothetical protein